VRAAPGDGRDPETVTFPAGRRWADPTAMLAFGQLAMNGSNPSS